MVKNNLSEPFFSEVFLLLMITLAIASASGEPEGCFSKLKHILTFVINTLTSQHLNAIATLSIQKNMMRSMNNFYWKVIEKLASAKTQGVEILLYKTSANNTDPN